MTKQQFVTSTINIRNPNSTYNGRLFYLQVSVFQSSVWHC